MSLLLLISSAAGQCVNEVTTLTGESKTEAVRKALLEWRDRVRLMRGGTAKRDLGRFMATHVWPLIPASPRSHEVTKTEVEEYPGFGPGGA